MNNETSKKSLLTNLSVTYIYTDSYKFISQFSICYNFIMQNYSHPCFVEITLISAQDLRLASSVFCRRRLRPFITINTAIAATSSDKQLKVYKTKVDEKGGVNPTWGDKFQLPLDQTFFYLRKSGIYLQLYTKHLLMGNTQLGWCLIPVSDIFGRLIPVGSTQFLSYRLRDRDGSRGHGVVNVAVKLEGKPPTPHPPRPVMTPDGNVSDMVIGIPVKMLPERNEFSQGHVRAGSPHSYAFSPGQNILDNVRIETYSTKNFAVMGIRESKAQTSDEE